MESFVGRELNTLLNQSITTQLSYKALKTKLNDCQKNILILESASNTSVLPIFNPSQDSSEFNYFSVQPQGTTPTYPEDSYQKVWTLETNRFQISAKNKEITNDIKELQIDAAILLTRHTFEIWQYYNVEKFAMEFQPDILLAIDDLERIFLMEAGPKNWVRWLYWKSRNYLNNYKIYSIFSYLSSIFFFIETTPAPNSFDSAEQWITSKKPSQSFAVEIFSEEKLHLAPPATVENYIPNKFKSHPPDLISEQKLYHIKNGRAFGLHGAVITPDNKLLEDLSVQYDQPENHSIFNNFRLPISKKYKNTVCVLSARSGYCSYFHWLLEVLPRFHILRESTVTWSEVDKYLINSLQHKFQRESITQLNISSKKIIESRFEPHIEAQTLLVPDIPGNRGHVPSTSIQFLRNLFEVDKGDFSKSNKRLYLSRNDGERRILRNEPEIYEVLKERGFKKIHPENHTIENQANLFHEADVILSPHGGGLSNIVFCQKSTTVIEIFHPDYIIPVYYSLSCQNNLNYHFALGNPIQQDRKPGQRDILLPMGKLQKILNHAGIE